MTDISNQESPKVRKITKTKVIEVKPNDSREPERKFTKPKIIEPSPLTTLNESNAEEYSDDSSSEKSEDSLFSKIELAKTIMVLKKAYDFAFDQHEIPEEQKSEAQKNDEARYKILKNKINSFITQYDENVLGQHSKYQKYLAFEEALSSSGAPLTINNVNKFKESLITLDEPLEDNSLQAQSKKAFLYARRKATAFMAGFILKPEDVAKLESLPKEKKEKIKIIQTFIEVTESNNASEQEKTEAYKYLNSQFQELTAKEKRRKNREFGTIIAKQMQREQLATTDTVVKIGEAILHPVAKIINDDNLNVIEKTAGITKKVTEKAIKIAQYGVEQAISSTQDLIRHTYKQPGMATERAFMFSMNAMEYLYAQASAFSEENPEIKAELQKEANKKFANLDYQGEKFLRAAAASAGVALLDIAAASSAGVSVPVVGAFISPALLSVANVADNLQNIKDVVEVASKTAEDINTKKEQFGDTIHERRGAAIFHDNLSEERILGQENISKRAIKNTAVAPDPSGLPSKTHAESSNTTTFKKASVAPSPEEIRAPNRENLQALSDKHEHKSNRLSLPFFRSNQRVSPVPDGRGN